MIDCDTAEATLVLVYDADETFVVAGVAYAGVTTLTPVLTLSQSALLSADTLTYDAEDYTTGDTYIVGTIEVSLDTSVTTV